ncbi:hypothetical protein Vau01_052110 [Virgisporangium aurantiacum]|uniref:Uncharacterized protein n=1 Tax=Virgisporangium aurantiacum TaxID=175570 RepID=A0A8J3ZA11_9ACTN|nr:hypothetical protein Vau01_052110 [Virgisporangium aurantiacum]
MTCAGSPVARSYTTTRRISTHIDADDVDAAPRVVVAERVDRLFAAQAGVALQEQAGAPDRVAAQRFRRGRVRVQAWRQFGVAFGQRRAEDVAGVAA